MRDERGLRQSDIPGLSERQVRRIEKAISRLSGDAANRFAAAFGMSVEYFLDQVARAAASADRSQVLEDDEQTASRSTNGYISFRICSHIGCRSVRECLLRADSGRKQGRSTAPY
jgi:transcriptional regulator with XRE-family HTH domain